ncbi:MAG: hypothetical protein LBV23_10335 [Deltaproteobacteria bacterium]|nr:hypothetical protein [Deltaproteobacteria bacterium]
MNGPLNVHICERTPDNLASNRDEVILTQTLGLKERVESRPKGDALKEHGKILRHTGNLNSTSKANGRQPWMKKGPANT